MKNLQDFIYKILINEKQIKFYIYDPYKCETNKS